MILPIFLVLLPFLVDSQSQCFLSNLLAGRKITCDSIRKWDVVSRKIKVPTSTSFLKKTATLPGTQLGLGATAPGQLPQSKFSCMDWQCVCNFITNAQWTGSVCQLPGGGQLAQLPRRELRYLSVAERQLYVQGFYCAWYDIYVPVSMAHSDPNQSPGAHSGPAFLPWHREMLKRIEIGIRTCNQGGSYPYANVMIPMWDSSQDADITDYMGVSAGWSMMFSTELMGTVGQGTLTDGMFGGFSGKQGATQRDLDGYPGQLFLMRRPDIQNMIQTHTTNQVLAATAGGQGCPFLPYNTLELEHGDPHVWIGGDMSSITTSTNDPMFFCHHTLAQRENNYNTASTSCYSGAHLPNAVMFPFTDFINTDGLSNLYTQNMYTYNGFPTCSNCSPYTFCHSGLGRCIGRVKPNAPCRPVNGVDPCYQSTCSSTNTNLGTCIPPSSDALKPVKQPPHVKGIPVKYETCFNTHPCCSAYASQGECKNEKGFMRVLCPMACGYCKPRTTYKDDCSDRHPLCKNFFLQGKCSKNKDFMSENCRKTCRLCHKTRAQTCTASTTSPSKSSKPAKKPASNLSVLATMTINVADIGKKPWACADFLPNCSKLQKDGLCSLDQIKENCRKTCKCCHSNDSLKKICA